MLRFGELYKQASNLSASLWQTYWEGRKSDPDNLEDGEIIFSKNNVCVHSGGDNRHIPGYFSIRVHKFNAEPDSNELSTTLIATWIPNRYIERNRTLNHPSNLEEPQSLSPYRTMIGLCRSNSSSPVGMLGRHSSSRRQSQQSLYSLNDQGNIINAEDVISALSKMEIPTAKGDQLKADAIRFGGDRPPSSVSNTVAMPMIRLECAFGQGSTPLDTPCQTPVNEGPNKGIFTVDLKQMKSLRLFFASYEDVSKITENNNTTGQLVIASRGCEFKVFHFHYGGLDKLVNVLEQWHFIRVDRRDRRSNITSGRQAADSQINCYHFSVCRPSNLKQEECHPEEALYAELTDSMFNSEILNEQGQVEDEQTLKRIVFFGGLDAQARKIVWPFLLQRFPFKSTIEEREQSCKDDRQKYEELNKKRLDMDDDEKDAFWKNVQCTIEKDVPRTDRSNPFFSGDQNENILIMKRILLNYAIYSPRVGYTQGMSDLLAPLLIEIRDESETFWNFVCLMERTLSFVSSPNDSDMERSLSLLREMLRLMNAKFYNHMKTLPDGLELLFAHRWILLCFKREFPDFLRIWEASWTRYQTDYFPLFVCLAIIDIYGQDVVEQDMRTDEILFHFSTLSMHMNGVLVLKKARGLLHEFRMIPRIPCTLEKLCAVLGTGNWDSQFEPTVDCIRDVPYDGVDRCQCKKKRSHKQNKSQDPDPPATSP